MYIPIGTLVNTICVAVGGAVGTVLGQRLSEKNQQAIFLALGLMVLGLGIISLVDQAPLLSDIRYMLILLISLVSGVVLGEWMQLSKSFHSLGDKLANTLRRSKETPSSSSFSEGFVMGTMVFEVGAMAILGPIQEMVSGDSSLLLVKSSLDMFASMALASRYGWGIAVSALSVLLFQGSVSLLALPMQSLLFPETPKLISAVGGLALIALGFNLLDIRKIELVLLVPSIPLIILIVYVLTGQGWLAA